MIRLTDEMESLETPTTEATTPGQDIEMTHTAQTIEIAKHFNTTQ